MLLSVFGSVIDDNELHFSNADTPILVTSLGIVIFVRALQPWKADCWIVWSLFDSLISINSVHYLNACIPIVVTELGIAMDVKLAHP